jgi:gamma-glutamylputrescine oxidase
MLLPPSPWLRDVDPRSVWGNDSPFPDNARVVVVGGGLMGVATTYWLAKTGIDVVLVEKQSLSWGASGRNAGLMLANSSALESPELLKAVLLEEEIDCAYQQTGHLALAATPSVWQHFCSEVETRSASLPRISVLDRQSCQDLMRMRIGGRFIGGRWYPAACVVHPCKLVYGLAAAARRYGAQASIGTTALSVVQQRGKRALLIATSRGTVKADHVVLACSSAVSQFLPHYSRIITPIRGQVLATEPMEPRFHVALGVDFGTVYWRQIADGRVILGGYRNLGGVVEQTRHQRTNPKIQSALEAFLPHSFPDFGPIRVSQRWAGIMDCTPDSRPIIGHDPQFRRCWIIAGFGGHGMPCGLGAARALVEAIEGDPFPEQLQHYRPGRFELPKSSVLSALN